MKSKMIGLFAVVMIALMVAGFAYAHWSETLYITGTVNTGKLDAKMSAKESWDSEPDDKDFSSISCEVSENDPKTLIVTVKNAYPCIDYYQKFDVTNIGTIPLHIVGFNVDPGTLPVNTKLEISMDNPLPVQVHPGESAYGKIHIHLDEDAAENTKYTFSVTIEVVQWNYAPPS
jgi:hypothetical protein